MTEYKVGSIQWGEHLRKELLRIDNDIMNIFDNALCDVEYEMVYSEEDLDGDPEVYEEEKQSLIQELGNCNGLALASFYGYSSREYKKYELLNEEFEVIEELLEEYPENEWFYDEPSLTHAELESAGQEILPSISGD